MLAIFMGGMAIGAWLPSRLGAHWKNLLIGYAIVEIVIGLCAFVFHNVFVGVTDYTYDTLIPALGSATTASALKWSVAALLILPQSILLGMTFPLMSAGLLRRHPENPGRSIATLYFTNSIGATIGVLASGFLLIDKVGLPGTVLTAGLINVALGLVVWLIARTNAETPPRKTTAAAHKDLSFWRLMLVASLLTGIASFIYEIGWIRMLSLVLGSSTHAFELMLSAFIGGLAFGGLWIRRRINRLKQPLSFLGWIQVAMGLLALATLPIYNASFDLMHMLMQAIALSDNGYRLFNVVSHAIAIFVMVPVTFCAGMTLPLITHTLLRAGHGEASIGAVYAANTVGAIIGVFLAIHVGLPVLGLKSLISTGAAIDMALGVGLLATAYGWRHHIVAIAASITVVALIAGLIVIELDLTKMASSVYRSGKLLQEGTVEVLHHKDGKTATINLLKWNDGSVSITTNGKSDANLNIGENMPASADEVTMTLMGAVPILIHPQARTAANIGMGAGLTTHVLLSSHAIERVDTIEIEPAMIEAAQAFRPLVESTFTDPRSHFHIDDAKTFFSICNARYDIIVSEPSNPWVSGVSGLFSDEFYRRTRTYLNPHGIFVQWLQLYEIDIRLVTSVMNAVANNFSDYDLFNTDNGNLLIVASNNGHVPPIDPVMFKQKNFSTLLQHIGITEPRDIELRRLGDRALLQPLFDSMRVPINSDYFPLLDQGAARTRFLRHDAIELLRLSTEPVPALEMLNQTQQRTDLSRYTVMPHTAHSNQARIATLVRDFYINGTLPDDRSMDAGMLRLLLLTQHLMRDCRGAITSTLWLDGIYYLFETLMPYINAADMGALWREFSRSDCHRRLTVEERQAFALFGAVGRRDARAMVTYAERLLTTATNGPLEQRRFLIAAGMLGYLAQNKPQQALSLWNAHATRTLRAQPQNILLRLLLAHSISRDTSR
ncbi:MAG TPA: fused MFS/spermidine synthase [Burkholderiales bacterium]|nr:fused MFS/spermidine synthase [Burkholderiales bacterium]